MVKGKRYQKFISAIAKASLFLGLSILPVLLKTKSASSAKKITTFIGPLQISIAVDSIETFAQSGKVNSDLALIVNRLDEPSKVKLRQILQQRFDDIDPTFISNYASLPIAEGIMNKIGRIVQPKPGVNGLTSMRSAAILAAADKKEGLTITNVLRRFPSQNIYLDFYRLLRLGIQFGKLAKYSQVAVAEVMQQSALEAEANPVDASGLADLSQPGTWQVTKQAMSFKVDKLRTKNIGLSSAYDLNFELYLPKNKSQPAPLIVVVQGFGATPDTYGYIAEQLASYGYAVASIEHLGTDLAQRMESPNGELNSWISPTEFVSRPSDVSHLLDKLEEKVVKDPQWAGKLNLDRVGVFGYSFGGYSVLALAGAEINHSRLVAECSQPELNSVLSFYFQCQAQYLSPSTSSLKDPRIKAVFSVYPLTNPVFGAAGMSKIDIPTMMVTGSKDTTVPPVQNQIHPFSWLQTNHKYLALLDPGTHFTSVKLEDRGLEGIPSVESPNKTDDKSALARNYLNTMSVAFFNRHLQGLEEYAPYLTAAYTQDISKKPLSINLIRSLNIEQLKTAYGKKPPLDLSPQPPTVKPKKETVLAEIKRTGVLKVGVSSNAAPVAYLNGNRNFTGYCASLINSLEDYLEIKLDRPSGIQTIALASNLENRDRLLQQKQVHLECGANQVRDNIEDITFSQPFFISETKSKGDRTEPNNSDVTTSKALTNGGYRMLLPQGDRTWQKTVNDFLSSQDK